MEKKVNNVTRSGDVEHQENPGSFYDRYSELLEVPVEYLKTVQWKVTVDIEEIKFVKEMMKKFRASKSDEIDEEKLKALEMLKAREQALYKVEDITFITFLWLATMKTTREAAEKSLEYFLSPLRSKTIVNLFDREEIDISALVDLADTNLKNIKAYNSKILASLEAEDLNAVTLQEMSNLYISFFKGIWTLDMKINILRFHLIHPRRDHKASVDKFAASVEVELQQYEGELKTTRFKVLQLVKKKINTFGLGWLPDSWKGAFVNTGMKTFFFDWETVALNYDI